MALDGAIGGSGTIGGSPPRSAEGDSSLAPRLRGVINCAPRALFISRDSIDSIDCIVIPIKSIRQAAEALKGEIVRTPLIPLPGYDSERTGRIYLKLEMLQPIGSFKIRGALNALRATPPEDLSEGIWTASAGNMAQGAAHVARSLGIPCTVLTPDTAPEAKRLAIERLQAKVLKVPFDRWWQAMEDRFFPGMPGRLLHPFDDDSVMAGNGTIALEVLEDLPLVDTVFIPWGGGGLACGIASAFRSLSPSTRLYAAEVSTAAPLAASLAAGSAQKITRVPSFVDGIGGTAVFPRMFGMARSLLDGSLTATPGEIEEAIRLLVERTRIVAEGAGACPVAVALSRPAPGNTVCIVSGGNIDAAVLARILRREPD